ncbi:AAA family ATPase [Orbus mooreae]|uniref:AAA family ATPase n=1 Tax=Orbus mooreae TaxID=3074107 RepID=UPI00370DBA2D
MPQSMILNNTTPKAIFLIGAAGSGKSTVGKFLASKFHYCYLDKDIVANRFTGELLMAKGYEATARDQCDYYKEAVMGLEYDTLLHLAGENLQLGNSVILDAPFLSYFTNPNYIMESINKFNWGSIQPYILDVFVEPDVLKQRIITRNNPRDTWKLQNWSTFISSIQQKKCLWQNVNYIRFNNSDSQIDETLLLSHFS